MEDRKTQEKTREDKPRTLTVGVEGAGDRGVAVVLLAAPLVILETGESCILREDGGWRGKA